MKNILRATLYLISFMALLLFIGGCGSGGGDGDGNGTPPANLEADVKISALQFGEATIFSVTVKSVTGVTDAASFNLIGQETRPNANLNEIADNFVLNQATIPLEIYNSSGTVIATATLDVADYATTFEGTLTLTASGQSQALASIASFQDEESGNPDYGFIGNSITSATQIDNLDILATGIIKDLSIGTRSIQVPLTCGPTQPGNVTPPAGQGFFIINDVIIEYYYGMNNPAEFNNVLSVKFRESGREFENMTLIFRLPGSSSAFRVRPEPQRYLTQAELDAILNTVNSSVNASNPWATAIAYVDLIVTGFGSTKLVETTVTRVEGNCVVGAKSFTVQEGTDTPEPPKAIGDEVDKNTLQPDLILYILGNEVDVRTQTLDECDKWVRANSGGSAGTLDNWDISKIPSGATFDFKFDSYTIADRFQVTYSGSTIDTGWIGESDCPAGGCISTSPVDRIGEITKGFSNQLSVLVTGNTNTNTAWIYDIRCNTP